MTHTTVTVSLKNPRHQHPVPAIFDNGKECVYVNQAGILKKISVTDYIDIATSVEKSKFTTLGVKSYEFKSTINNLQKGMEEKDVRLTHLGLTFTVNGDTSQQGDIDFWKSHPMAEVDGVRVSLKHPLKYIVTDLSNQKVIKQTNFKKKLEIINFINSMKEVELRNSFVYLGSSPVGKTKEDIVIELVEEPGIIFKADNLEIFERVFVRNEDSNKALILNINKAKVYGLLSLKGVENAKGYYYKEAFCGVDERDVQVYFRRNEKIFESMSAEIERIEGINYVDKKEDIIPENAKTDSINIKTELIQKLNGYIKKDIIKLPESAVITTLSIERLNEYLEEAKESESLKSSHKTEHIDDSIKENIKSTNKGFEPKQESESTVKYKGRLSKQLGVLIEGGSVSLPIGTKRNTLSVDELESYLTKYFDKLNSPA